MPRAYIGIGSNLGMPRRQVEAALAELRQVPHSALLVQSPLYRSKPVGPQDQPDYINAVAAVDTGLEALDLLEALQSIEQRYDRRRDGERWGARTLDLDILLYGDQQIDSDRLQVPHPEMPRRGFVLQPLHDIAPSLIIPGLGSLPALLAEVSTADLERITDVEA